MNDQPEISAPDSDPIPPAAEDDHVIEQDLLVEEVSIDGMCGVY